MRRANHSLEMPDVFTHPLVSGNLGGRPTTPCMLPYPVVASGEFPWGLRGLAQLDSMPWCCRAAKSWVPREASVLSRLDSHFRGANHPLLLWSLPLMLSFLPALEERTSFLRPDSKGLRVKGLMSSFTPWFQESRVIHWEALCLLEMQNEGNV